MRLGCHRERSDLQGRKTEPWRGAQAPGIRRFLLGTSRAQGEGTERVRQPPQPPTLRPREGSLPPLLLRAVFFVHRIRTSHSRPQRGPRTDMQQGASATCAGPTMKAGSSPIEVATGPRSLRSGGSPNPRRSVSVSGSFDSTPGSPRCTSCRNRHPCPASCPPCSRNAGSGTRPNPHIVDAAVP